MSLMIESSKPHQAKHAVIYARVSSTKQTTRGDGLNSQITRCSEYAKYKGYEIVETFSDDASGSLKTRPGMKSMLTFLKANKKTCDHVVIIDDISRLARGIEAHLSLRSEIAEAGGILESPSIEFGEDSDSQLVENLLAAVSQHQRQKNGEQTKNRMKARAQNGYWVFHAPFGYKFEKVPGHSNLLVRHEPMASVLQEALEGFASGRFETQAEVLRFFDSLPHFPRDSRGIIRHQRVRDLLTNPIYAGMVEVPNWDISRRKGHHEGLISYSTFQNIQDKLNKPKVPIRKNVAHDFPLRGFITCSHCNTTLTSCWAKGRYKKYPYYHCPTKGCVSYGKSIKRETIEGEFEGLLEALQPSPKLFDVAYMMFKDAWNHQHDHMHEMTKRMQAELKKADDQIAGLMERIISAETTTVIKAYEKRIGMLETDKLLLQEKIAQTRKPKTPFEESFRTAFDFLKSPVKLWRTGNLADQKTVLKLTFAKRLSYAKNEGFRTTSPSLPFQLIQGLKGDCDSNFSGKNSMAHRGSVNT